MDESTNKAIEETNANAVDSSSIISEKLKETVASAAAAAAAEVVSSTTPAIGLLNGETTNGIYKAEQMDVDTEDESQLFSENGISQSTDDIIIKKNVTDDISSGKNKNDEELKMNTEEEEEDSLVSPKYEDIRSPNSSPLAEAMDTSEIKTTEEVKCNDIQIENDGIEKNKEDTILESNPSCDGNNVESDIENSKQNGSKEKDTVLVSTNENQIEEEKKTTSKVVENDKNDDSGESRDSFSKKNGTVDINNKQLPSKCKSEETSTELPTSQDDGNEVGVVDDDKDNGDVKLPNKNDIVNVEDLDIKEVSKNGNDQPEPMDVSDSISINGAEGCESVKNKNNNENEKTEQESSKENNDLVKETTEDVKEPDDKKEKVDNENVINGLTTKSGKNVDSKIHIIALDDDDVEEVEKPSSSTSVVASKNDNCVQDEKMDVDTSPGKLSIVKEKESVVEESVVIGSDSETEMDTDNQTKKIEDPLSDQLSSTVTVTSTTPTQEAKTSISPLEDTVTTLSTSESIIAPAPVLVSASVSPTASVSSSASVSALPLESASTSTSASAPASASASALSLAELPLVKQLSSELITQILSITSSTILSPTPNVTNVIAPPTLTSIQNDAPKSNLLKYPQKPDDDDDDDCVVIEDDDDNNMPIPKTMTNIRNFASLKDDMSIGDDSQPPAKKQKITINNNSNITQIGQITIKDARSLMPHSTNETSFQQTFANNIKAKEAPGLVIIEAVSNNPQALKQNLGIVTDSLLTSPKTGEANRNIYPINLRVVNATSTNVSLSPPKLVPVSNSVVGVSSLSNADLLPGLTDDMFVLEAPSFIVPYIYEKPPSDNLREIIAKIIEQYELKKELESQLPDSNLDENKANEDKSTTSTSDALISTSVPSTTSADLGAAALSAITSSPQPSIATSTITTGSSSTAEENKGNKKKSSSYTGDESWAESEDSDEEDEDSENETRTKVLIKEATDDLDAIKEVIKPNTPIINTSSVPGDKSDNYFDSPLGKFFLDIGVGLVQEFVQVDLLRLQKKKLRKCQKQSNANKTELENAIQALGCNLETSRKKNAPFKFERKRCEFCNFKSESLLSMANHYEAPHQNGVMYRCNFCPYEIRSSHDIIFHMETMHNIQGRIEKSLSYNQCPLCPFEDNGKSRFARHIPTCVKKYRPEVNLAPPHDWEGPAKIPRIKPRHGLVGTATAYQAMAAQAAAQKAAIAALQLQQQQQHARNLSPLTQNNVNAAKLVRRPQTTTNKTSASLLRVNQPTGVNRQPPPTAATTTTTNMMLPNNYQISGGQLIQVSASGLAILPNSQNTLTLQSSNAKKTTTTGQPSISITPLPRQPTSSSSSSSTIKTQNNTIKPGQGIAGNKASFVICEICDGYIKDLEQLRNHMQWMHKVKIHPKMIYNRPPLNCQKCQFRFFTDQGLERHLLGSHGLVTSSMQEAANKGKDAGRCPVCGRMYQWKLLNHVSRDHHMTLKPAHLSYKCTVCTATFGMYKQFENHVYTAHSTVAKKAMDNKKSSTNSNSNNNTGNNNNSHNSTSNSRNLSASNDALLKPLKINDEITIIPQPASKMRNTSSSIKIESHVID